MFWSVEERTFGVLSTTLSTSVIDIHNVKYSGIFNYQKALNPVLHFYFGCWSFSKPRSPLGSLNPAHATMLHTHHVDVVDKFPKLGSTPISDLVV